MRVGGARPQRHAQAAAVLSVSPTELFDWAEATYPEHFPGRQTDQTLAPYVFRFYPTTGNYVGLSGQSIVILGPISGGAVVEVGKLADFACLVRPALCNTPPVADAGPAQSVLTGATVKLDGSKSTDADLNQLTFSWRFTSKPSGSTAVLSDAKAVQPTFVADKAGQYVAELVVSDSLTTSTPVTVTITATAANVAPTADAGKNQSVIVGVAASLDGRGSKDANGDTLTYLWTLTAKPAGSTATLGGTTSSMPILVPDKAGTYTVSLVVSDGRLSSSASTVTITAAAANATPVANAGPAQTVGANVIATLNGTLSSDANGDPLSYLWAVTTKPAGSTALLSSYTVASPLFLADTPGTYVVSLIVNDGKVPSAPATVTITVTPGISSGNSQAVSVTRIDSNVYFDSGRRLLLLTNFCYEYVYYDSATITMTGSTGSYDGKIKFSNGKTCDVAGGYTPSSLSAGNYTATLTREEQDIYKDTTSGSVIWTQFCYQFVYGNRATLRLTFSGTAYLGGAQIGSVQFSSGSSCNMVGVFKLAKLN